MRAAQMEVIETRDSVIIELRDTVREVTTITIRENEQGDTIKVVQITNRERVRSRDRAALQEKKVEVRVDTVYIDKEVEKTVAAAGPGVEIDKEGNVTKTVNRLAQTLKWIFLVIVAVIVLIVVVSFMVPPFNLIFIFIVFSLLTFFIHLIINALLS